MWHFELVEQLPKQRHFILDYQADIRLFGGQAAELDVTTLVLTHLIPEPAAPTNSRPSSTTCVAEASPAN